MSSRPELRPDPPPRDRRGDAALAGDALDQLVGESARMRDVREQVRSFVHQSAGRRPPPVLLLGETGTGKGMLARALHQVSPRASGPFVDVNCAALPDALLEAELFGYERGAFTDARHGKPGLFQHAHRGTLFLDEIGAMPAHLQPKLLSVIEAQAVRRLGAIRAEPVDVWVIAATNEDLNAALESGAFRKDFYHRVAVLTLTLPALRERDGDLGLLAEHFLAQACADYGLPAKSLSADARAAIRAYWWPGNVRELSNVIERTALLSQAPVIGAAQLALPDVAPARPPRPEATARGPAPVRSSSDMMREHLSATLEETGWNISRTAERLGLSRNTVRARIERFRLRPTHGEPAPPAVAPIPLAEREPARRAPVVPGLWQPRPLAFLGIRVTGSGEGESATHRVLGAIADKIAVFGGRVETQGPTGLGAVFGLRRTDEPAVLAAHSALVVRNAVRRDAMRADQSLAIAMGLHTGEVLVSPDPDRPTLEADESRRAWNAIDNLLAIGARDATLLTEQAAALLRRRFVLVRDGEELGYRLEGFLRAGPQAGHEMARLVGRREEVQLLESRADLAARGLGQVIDIVGEAGIGKSRLVLELVSGLGDRGATYLEGRCSPATTTTPFAPVLSILHDACGTSEADSPDLLRDKTMAVAAGAGLGDLDVAPALARLLTTAPDPRLDVDPAQLRRRFFRVVCQFLVGLSRVSSPLVIAVEDLHWVDPTSEECLAALVEGIGAAPILLITTCRPGHRPPWAGRSSVMQLPLAPLSPEHSADIVHGVLGGEVVPDAVVHEILVRAEGNPLFLEELSRAALERRSGRAAGAVPTTVEEVIRDRMERLRPRTRLALGLAAVIGRQAPMSVLRRASGLTDRALEERLDRLQRADFMHETALRGTDRTFTFKHALVREVAYSRLPAAERRTMHGRVLASMEELYADRLAEHAEELAHHAVLAEDIPRAVRYLFQTGQKAAARSAQMEAIDHFQRALRLLVELPPGRDRDRAELDLQLALGIALRATRGAAAPETGQALERAKSLCQALGDVRNLGAVFVGQWFTELLRARYGSARSIAEQLHELAERDGGDAMLAIANRAVGMTALHEGDVFNARRSLELALAQTYPEDSEIVRHYGGDPRVSSLAYLGRSLWSLGYPDQALARNRDAVVHAERRGVALDLVVALSMLISVHQLRRDFGSAREGMERALSHARQHGTNYWLVRNGLLLSWAHAMDASDADRDASIAAMQKSLEQYRATGTLLGLSWFLSLLAQAFRAAGRLSEGLQALDDALAFIESTGERYHEADVYCLKGELTLASGGSADTAASCFRHGLEIAQRQRARSWELRSATRLAALLRDRHRAAEARAVLGPVYAWFTEGFDTPDLVDARALLADLGEAAPEPSGGGAPN